MRNRKHFENLHIDKTTHFQQCDNNILSPLESELLTEKKHKDKSQCLLPPSRIAKVYQYKIALWLQFLYNLGDFNENGANLDAIDANLKVFSKSQPGQMGHTQRYEEFLKDGASAVGTGNAALNESASN